VLVTKKLTVLILVLVLPIAACKKKEAAPSAAQAPAPASAAAGTTPGAPTAPAVKPVPAQLPEVVARVNGEAVKKAEIEMAVKTLEDRARTPVPAEQRDAVYRQVLDRIVGYHLLVQETRTRKIVAPPWEVDNQINQIKKQFPTEDAFKQMLQSRGVTVENLRSDTAETIAVNQMLQKELEPKVKVTEADMKTFFDQNRPKFRQEDSVHASHILIRVDEKADAAAKAAAKARADDLLKQLKKGAAFADLAKKNSQDPGSAPNGGDLGFFSRGQMVPAFEAAAFALQPGQTSSVVETPFGYHVIRVSEAKPGRDLNFDEVKGQIDEYLKQQQRDQHSQEFVDQLKAKAKIEIVI
jgi:peptidyl-prolyl cis-trans isomerase C